MFHNKQVPIKVKMAWDDDAWFLYIGVAKLSNWGDENILCKCQTYDGDLCHCNVVP